MEEKRAWPLSAVYLSGLHVCSGDIKTVLGYISTKVTNETRIWIQAFGRWSLQTCKGERQVRQEREGPVQSVGDEQVIWWAPGAQLHQRGSRTASELWQGSWGICYSCHASQAEGCSWDIISPARLPDNDQNTQLGRMPACWRGISICWADPQGPLKWAKAIRVEHRQHLLQTPASQSVHDNVCQGAATMSTSKGPTQ